MTKKHYKLYFQNGSKEPIVLEGAFSSKAEAKRKAKETSERNGWTFTKSKEVQKGA